MDDQTGESLQERINRLVDDADLNVNRLARESRQTLSNVHKIVKKGSLPNRETMKALVPVLDPDGNERLLFYRDVEELVRLGYPRDSAEGVVRLAEADERLRAELVRLSEALSDADESTIKEFIREAAQVLDRLGLSDPETQLEHAGPAGR